MAPQNPDTEQTLDLSAGLVPKAPAPQTDNEPAEFDRLKTQYPTMTSVDNGIAYDVSHKALGPITQKATAAAAPKPGDQSLDLSAGFVPKMQPGAEQSTNPDEPSNWQTFKTWVNKGLISPDTITRAMTGYTPEEIQSTLVNTAPSGANERKIVHVPGYGDIDLYTFFGGMMGTSESGNIAHIASSQTSPIMLTTMAGGHVIRAMKVARSFATAAETLKAADADLDAAVVTHAARLDEIANATKQVSQTRQALDAAITARDAGAGTQEAVIQARNVVSEATANLGRARQAVEEAQEFKGIAGVRQATAARNATQAKAAAETLLGRTVGRVPIPQPIVTAANIGQKLVGTYFTGSNIAQALTPRGEKESLPDYIGRVAIAGAYGLMGAEETARDITGTARMAANAPEAFKDWYQAKQRVKEATSRDEAQIQGKKDFNKAIPPGPGKANYTDDDYAVVRPFLEDSHANHEEIETPQDVHDAVEHQRKGIENILKPWIKTYTNESLNLGKNADGSPVTIKQKLVAALMPDEQVNAGFLNKALKAIAGYNTTNPTLGESDAIRAKLNAETRGILQKNMWDVATARAKDPAFAAMDELNDILRTGINDTLQAKGVDGAQEMRQAESSLIRVRNAADRQIKNEERVKRGTGEQGGVRGFLAKGAEHVGVTTGAAIGGAVGGPLGAAAGAEAGKTVGKSVGGLIAKPDLTVKQLLQRSMTVSNAPDTRPTIDAKNALPAAEKPAPHPRENTPLHADLVSHYGEEIGDTPYGDLEKRFLSDVQIKKEHGVPLEASEKALLLKVNKAKITEIKEAQKTAEDNAKDVLKQQVVAQKEAVKAEAEKKAVKAAAKPPVIPPATLEEIEAKKKAKVKAETEEEEKGALAGRALRDKLVNQVKAGEIKPTAVDEEHPVTVPHSVVANTPNGETPEEVMEHEHSHNVVHMEEFGKPARIIAGEDHPTLGGKDHSATIGYGYGNVPLVMQDANSAKRLNSTPADLLENTRQWIAVHMGGAAGQELLHDIPVEENKGLAADRASVKRVYDVARAQGVPLDSLEEEIDRGVERAKKNLTKPGNLGRVVAESSARAVGEGPGVLTGEERMRAIGRAHNERTEAARVAGPAGGNVGVPEANAGRREGGRGAPPIPAGEAARAGEQQGALAKSNVNALAGMKDKYGESENPRDMQAASFVTPEGKFVHLPQSVDHFQAITEHGGPASDATNGYDNRPAFMNDTGAVRLHLANERAGKTLAVSVPQQGIEPEQVNAIRQTVGQVLPRTGNLRMERVDVKPETKNELTTEKAFPRATDVVPMLKKIQAITPETEQKSALSYEPMDRMRQIREEEAKAEKEHPVVNSAAPAPTPVLEPTQIQGGTHADPKPTYHEAAAGEGNPWVRRSADPAKSAAPTNAGRQLMVQFSSDLINGAQGEAGPATKYYDKLYSGARPGYARLQDFWEIPQWMGFVSHNLPDADVYVVRNVDQAKNFLNNAGYDRVLFSALDVNKNLIKDIAKDYKGRIDVGGYVEPGTFLENQNIKYHPSVESLATDVNGPGSYKNGTDYRHFEGSDVIPRLTMSDGCLHKCAFCVVPKNLTTQSDAVVDQQADSMSKLGAKLVYLNDKTFGQASNYQHLSDVYDRMKTANPDFKGFIVQTTAAQMSKIPADWLQKSGIKYVELGIESYNDPILKEMHKPANQRLIDQATDKLRQNKIALIPNILIGLPGETAETYNNTLEFLKRNKDTISHANIYNLAVYPDAELGKKLTTASPDDFNENVLEKSFHTNPEVHRQFAGDLYGIGEELLGGKPKPLEETSALAKDQPKKIGDMDENDLTFTGHTNRLYERAATSNAQNGGFTVHPDTGHAPNDGHVIEVMPERRQKIENKPVASAEDIRKFHEANKDVIAENPELHLGGYKNQLNLSAVGTPEGARTVGNKLDQESGWDARNQQLVPYEGKGEKTEFPGYSVDQRLKEMGARDENGKPTNVGVPVKPIEETSGLKKVPAVRELSTGDVAEDKIIRENGGIPGGLFGDRARGVRMFHDPITHSTLGFAAHEEVTPENVQAKLLDSRKQFATTPQGRSDYGLNEDGTPEKRSAPVKPFDVEWKPNGRYGVVNPKGITLDTFPTREAAETAAQRMAEQSARIQEERSELAKKTAQKAAAEAAKKAAAAPKPQPAVIPAEATHVLNPETGKIEPVPPKAPAPGPSSKELGATAEENPLNANVRVVKSKINQAKKENLDLRPEILSQENSEYKGFIGPEGEIYSGKEHEDILQEHGVGPVEPTTENEAEWEDFYDKQQHVVDDAVKKGFVRVAGLGMPEAPLYVQISASPTEAQRAAIGKAIRQQGGVIFDVAPKGLLGSRKGMISGESTLPGDLWRAVDKVFPKEENPLDANVKAPFKTEPHQPFPKNQEDILASYGMSMPQVAGHEGAHHLGMAINGFETRGTIGPRHPEARKVGGIARAEWNQSQFRNAETGEIDQAAVKDRIGDLLFQMYMGPVHDELYHGIKLENNVGATADLKNVNRLIDIGLPGISEADRAALHDAAIDRARTELTRPGVRDILQKYTNTREAGIPEEWLMTPETTQKMLGDLRELRGQNGKETEADLGVNEPANTGLRGRGGENVTRGEGRGGESALQTATTQARAGRGIETEGVKLFEKAAKHYGTTDDIKKAGFIGPDGRMLDFSDGQAVRVLDHGDISTVHDTENPREQFTADTGAMRILHSPRQNYVGIHFDFDHLPTEAQLERVVPLLKEGTTVEADISSDDTKKTGLAGLYVGGNMAEATDMDGLRRVIDAAQKDANVKAAQRAGSPLSQNLSYEAMKGMKEARESEDRARLVNAAPPTPVPTLDPAKIQGGEHATPAPTYHEASQTEGNPWVRKSADAAQRAAIGKAIQDQGSVIYDLVGFGRNKSGEAKSPSDFFRTMSEFYGKDFTEPKANLAETHPHLPDSVTNDMDADELAYTANKPAIQKNIFKELNKIEPTVDEVANAAKAGHVLGGWWQRYIDAFKVMGEPNEAAQMEQIGPSHTEALKAFHGALSGNKSVEAANKLAWNAYHDWLEEGRPHDRGAINQIIARNGLPKGVAAISDTHAGDKVTHEGLDTTKLFKLVNSPQMRDENPEPFTGNAFLDSPVYGTTSGAKKIPSMVATTTGEGNLNRVVFDTHMKDLYAQNDLTDARYIADSIHMRRAARELGLKAGEGQEQVWGAVLGLKELLGKGTTPEEAAQGLDDPVVHGIGKDYAAVILEAIETDPEFRSTLDGLHKYGFSPTSDQALAKLRDIVKSGEARIGTGPEVNRELLGKTAERMARHMGIDVDAARRQAEENPTFNFGYNEMRGGLDKLAGK